MYVSTPKDLKISNYANISCRVESQLYLSSCGPLLHSIPHLAARGSFLPHHCCWFLLRRIFHCFSGPLQPWPHPVTPFPFSLPTPSRAKITLLGRVKAASTSPYTVNLWRSRTGFSLAKWRRWALRRCKPCIMPRTFPSFLSITDAVGRYYLFCTGMLQGRLDRALSILLGHESQRHMPASTSGLALLLLRVKNVYHEIE